MAHFQYSSVSSVPGSLMPRLSLEISTETRSIQIHGIVDSGSPVSVLPYSVGAALGAVWEEQESLGMLAGALASVESRVLPVDGMHPDIEGAEGVPLLFAWAQTNAVPVLLGQTNFLMEFNVCLYRSENAFEVWRV